MERYIDLLMKKYGLPREQATRVAMRTVVGMRDFPANEAERQERSEQDTWLRRRRVETFNRIEQDIAAGRPIRPDEEAWYRAVKQRAGTVQAAAVRPGELSPIALDQPGDYFQGEYQKAAKAMITVPPSEPFGAPLRARVPDPTRYELLSPVEAFTEAFNDNNTAPTIDPVSGSPVGSADYHAFYESLKR